MTCRCDVSHCPGALFSAAGLTVIPRAPGQFSDWRRALLEAIGREPTLRNWRAREPGDLGLMLMEMGAYIFDVVSFYDQLIANESYLRTARLTGAQRRHVSLLGYLPRPATGSSVWLAAEADGTRLLKLPAGTAIRSGTFEGNPPQVFELGADAIVEPWVNKLEVQRVSQAELTSPLSGIMAYSGSVRVKANDLVVFDANGTLVAAYVQGTTIPQLRTREAITRIDFEPVPGSTSPGIPVPPGTSYDNSRLLKPGSTCGAWKLTPASGEPQVLNGNQLSLDTRLNLHAGEVVAITDGTHAVACRITAVGEAQYTLLGSLTSTITDPSNKVSTMLSPAIRVSVTQLTFEAGTDLTTPFGATPLGQLVVHYTMVEAAELHAPQKDTLSQGDLISIPDLMDSPRINVGELMLEDVHGDGVVVCGRLDAGSHSAVPAASPAWGRELWMPVQLYGNAVSATRGESVHAEMLGVGDASQSMQTFRLKKKPMTYLQAANATGRKSTLVIHVGGVQWQEIESFYGAKDQDTVYIVRHDDAGEADVQFGGGARLPTGAAVVADYRFGAGAAAPPADSVKQVTRPVAGLRRIRNILPAFGGSDAEGAAELSVRGPNSALLLGRAISLLDMETAAALQPGVRAARAAWRWDGQGLRPAVIVSYIGDPQLAPALQAALRGLAEYDAPITAMSATAQSAELDVDIDIDSKHVPEDVIAAVCQALFATVTLPGTGGLLRPERLGPDGVVFESVIVRAVMEVPGVVALRSLVFDGTAFIETARKPAAGTYFDFAANGVKVNGKMAV